MYRLKNINIIMILMQNNYDILIIGCGLSGVVCAERFANVLDKKVLIIEKRDHIGGNVYDYIDTDTNILMNKYGAHLFHTNEEKVWNYINQFDEWVRWDHQVIGAVDNKLVNIPVNINTVNALCNENIKNTDEMNEWLNKNQVKYDVIDNGEKMGKSRVGEILYDKIFKQYTYKQWNKYPEELDASVLARIPIRHDFDNRYFDDKYQALPKYGYTHFVSKMLENKNINVLLNTNYFDFIKENPQNFETIIYTGPIDKFYEMKNMEKLEYRSIDFQIEKIKNMNYFQTNSVVNYPETNVEFTRIVEYKHFLNQKSTDTVIVREVTKDEGEPYYPIPNKKNLELYEKYKEFAEKETNVHFLGRLANYKYFNMDTAILNALNYFEKLKLSF
jgi:UDP-galactopyranose mutase